MANRKPSLDRAPGKTAAVDNASADIDTSDMPRALTSPGTTPSTIRGGRLWGGGEIEVPENLGKRLAAIRAERKMTQSDLAVRLGKSRTTVNQYEMGNISPPLLMINEMAHALDVDPAVLAFGHGVADDASKSRIWLMQGGDRTDDFVDVSAGLQGRLRLNPEESCLIELMIDAPIFNLRRGDQLFIDRRQQEIFGDGRLYAVRSAGGDLNIIRSDIHLESPVERVRITFGQGQISEVIAGKVDVIGIVRGTLRLE